MDFFVWQRSVVDEAGSVLPLASVSVTDVVSGALAQLYSDEGVTGIGNPITADSNGFVQFFVKSGIYTVVATLGLESRTWTKEAIGSPNKRNAAEIVAGVTPTNFAVDPLLGNVERYGNNATPGTTDMRLAWVSAYAVFKAGGAAPTGIGTHYLSQNGATGYALLFDDDVVIDGGGRLTFVGDDDDYNLIRIDGGTDVDIDLRGIKFDHGNATPDAAATDHICLRIESSINTIRLENLDFSNYEADGIYFRADVNGPGGFIKKCTASNAGRSLITIAKGEKLTIERCVAVDIGLQPFMTTPTDNTTVLRNIDFVGCSVHGGGNFGGAFATTDRAGFFLGGSSGASATVQGGIRAIDCSVEDFGNSAPGTVPLVFGIETRELFAPIVTGFFARNCRDAGLYSYLTTSAVFRNCYSTGNDKGLWMNDCTDYTEENNTCIDNTTADRDYSGPDGDSTYLYAQGLNTVLGSASVGYDSGNPVLFDPFNISVARHSGAPAGDLDFTFTNPAGSANYRVIATFRSHTAAAGGLIQSASHTTAGFRFQTYSSGSLSDQGFDIEIRGVPEGTVLP